jgi:hypothetical protein
MRRLVTIPLTSRVFQFSTSAMLSHERETISPRSKYFMPWGKNLPMVSRLRVTMTSWIPSLLRSVTRIGAGMLYMSTML